MRTHGGTAKPNNNECVTSHAIVVVYDIHIFQEYNTASLSAFSLLYNRVLEIHLSHLTVVIVFLINIFPFPTFSLPQHLVTIIVSSKILSLLSKEITCMLSQPFCLFCKLYLHWPWEFYVETQKSRFAVQVSFVESCNLELFKGISMEKKAHNISLM